MHALIFRHPARPTSIVRSGLVLVAALLVSGPIRATTYSVGSSASCTHSGLISALAAAVADASPGPHEIKIAYPAIGLADTDYTIADPQQDIAIRGGYANCADAAPAAGARTVLTNSFAGRRVLAVSNALANPRRFVYLSALTLRGGQNPSSLYGGGLLVSGRATVQLLDQTYIQENEAGNGGGVGLLNLSVDPDHAATLLVYGGSRICDNRAGGPGVNGNGGGVHMLGSSVLRLWDGQICGNEARRHGGGVYMNGDANSIRLDPLPGEIVEISSNVAGDGVFSATTGFGGGIYAGPNSAIQYETGGTPPAEISLILASNEANFGGALFAQGGAEADSPFTALVMRNAALIGNLALGRGGAVMLRNAVDLRLVKFGAGICQFFGPTPCVWGISNTAENNSFSTSLGGGGFAFLEHDTGAPRPALRVAGALLSSNTDPNGTAAVVDARDNSSVRILRSVFSGNSAGGSVTFRALIESRANSLFAYNTVLSNSVTRLLWQGAGSQVDATGSILYAPSVTPFVGDGGSTLVHNNCLISHTSVGLPPGVTVMPPQLGVDYAPKGGSPAIDACSNGVGDIHWPSGLDAYGASAPVNVPSIPNIGGIWDLGAVEQRDIVFYGGFGTRHAN